MKRQNPINLNLSRQETECILEIVKLWRQDYKLKNEHMKPCYPFIDKLQAKIIASLNKK